MPIPSLAFRPPPPAGEPPWRVGAIWYAANGDELMFTDCPAGIDWQVGRAGFDMPSYSMEADPVIGDAGDTLRSVRALARDVTVPLLVHKLTTYSEFVALKRRLLRALNPDPLDGGGPGRLAILHPTGEVRYITATYVSGAEGADVRDVRGAWWRKYPIILRAHEPFWRGLPQKPRRWNAAPPVPFFPLLPLRLRPSLILGVGQILNVAGDVRTWPTWTIKGPFVGTLIMRHQGLAQEWSMTLDLDAGETRVVTTQPGLVSVRDGAGANRWAELGDMPELWPLLAGPNVIDLEMAGAGSGSYVELSPYDPRYLGE